MILLLMIASVSICLFAMLVLAFIAGMNYAKLQSAIDRITTRITELDKRKRNKDQYIQKSTDRLSEILDPDDVIQMARMEHDNMMKKLNGDN